MLLTIINKISGFLFTKSSKILTNFIIDLNNKIENLGKNSSFFNSEEKSIVFQNIIEEQKKALKYFESFMKETNLVSKMGIKIKLMEVDFYETFYKNYKGFTQIFPITANYAFMGGGASTFIFNDKCEVDYYLIIMDKGIKDCNYYNFMFNHEVGHCINDHINPLNQNKQIEGVILNNDRYELEADLYAISEGYKMPSLYDMSSDAVNVTRCVYTKILKNLGIYESVKFQFNLSLLINYISIYFVAMKRKLMVIKYS